MIRLNEARNWPAVELLLIANRDKPSWCAEVKAAMRGYGWRKARGKSQSGAA